MLYLDEAGCTGILSPKIQPAFCMLGLIAPLQTVPAITRQFLELKREFNPSIAAQLKHDLDIILYEVKGSSLKRDIRSNRSTKRRAFGFLDKIFNIIEHHNCHIIARCHVKGFDKEFDGQAIYTSATQQICRSFQHFLNNNQSTSGLLIADSRRHRENTSVYHSIFTKKYKQTGDEYPNIMHPPLFGHSENHVGLQLADLIVSAVLMPIIIHVYCTNQMNNAHIRYEYSKVQDRYAERLKQLQYRYQIETGAFKGGITVQDNLLQSRSAKEIFR